jgi:hypothetical protein
MCRYDDGYIEESSSASIDRAALIPVEDSSAIYGRRVKLTYKIKGELYAAYGLLVAYI